MLKSRVGRFWAGMCISALAAAWVHGAALGDGEAVSPRLEHPVAVDGRLDEPAWSDAARLGRMVSLGDGAPTMTYHAEVRVAHDEEALYIGVESLAPEGYDFPQLGRNDDQIWRNDRIEVFVDPRPGTEEYFQLVVDRAGNVLDSRRNPPAGEPSGTAWDGEWSAATAQTERGWTMEMALPYAALDAPPPEPGDLWRLKVCRSDGGEGHVAWPANLTFSFHSREADGALYFERMNLLENPDFEEGEPGEDGMPQPWRASLTSSEVDHIHQGTVETLPGAGVEPDSRAVRMTKIPHAMWWPQIWSPRLELEPGAAYEFSVKAKGDLPKITLRASCWVDGQRIRLNETFDTPSEWGCLRHVFIVPQGTDRSTVGFSAPRVAGEIFFDRAMLRRSIAPVEAVRAKPSTHKPAPDPEQTLSIHMPQIGEPSPPHEPDPDPVQGLDAFMQRHGHKPFDLFESDGELKTLRVIFQDRQFGTPVWMLDNSPTREHCGTASVWSAWNPVGSTIYVDGSRYIGGRRRAGWFFNADFSRMRPAPGGRPAVWSPDDPYVYYGPNSPHDYAARTDLRTGAQETVAEWERLEWPGSYKRFYGLTSDERHLFVDLPNRGIFVPFEVDDDHPIPRLALYDGRPIGPEGVSIGNNRVNVIYNHEEHGDLIALRTGMLVDRQTGEKTYVAAPLCGNENYLRAFHEGRVQYPQGEEWNDYGLPWFADNDVRLPEGMGMEELYDLWLNIPHATHGHESHSPDRRYFAMDGWATRIVRVRDAGELRSIRLSPSGSNYHLHLRQHPRFFVAWVRGWQFGSLMRPANANVEFQVFCDATAQPIVDTKHRFNGYYAGGDFSMLSPDATKIHYGSSMTGRFRNYIAVMARPRPPKQLAWRAEGGAVALEWEPSEFSRETRGYLVYRGQSSGGPYSLLTPGPVEGASWRDETAQAGQDYYYVVTSLEHSGLESGYSEEAARAGVDMPAGLDAPLAVYAEAEDSVRNLPTWALPGLAMGVDRFGASDWYYLYRHPEADEGEAELEVNVPADAEYHVWARVRAEEGANAQWQVSLAGRNLEVSTDSEEWTWVRAEGGPAELAAGRAAVGLATSDAAAQMDLICLATDAGFAPEGPRPEDAAPPDAPAALGAENVRKRVNRLEWEPSGDPAFSHFQVYASDEPNFEPGQGTLIGSPTYGDFIDWGLKAGQRYHYAVTAVDRRGNESAPARADAATPDAEHPPFEAELAFAEAELEGPFERTEAGGLRGPAFVVAEEPDENRATWRVEVPREGDYYLWLRHLLRGRGGRGPDVRQHVRVRANGQEVATLGGGLTDLNVRDTLIQEGHPMASRVWTWAWPGVADLERTRLPAGEVEIVLDNFAPDVRYDVLVITDEPSFLPEDGRLRQR